MPLSRAKSCKFLGYTQPTLPGIVSVKFDSKYFPQPNILRRSPYPDFKFTWFNSPFHVPIQNLEVFGKKRERDGLRFARLQSDTLKSTQNGFIGYDAADFIAQVQLHHLVTSQFTDIGHIHRYSHGTLRIKSYLFDGQTGVSKWRIAQPVSKRIEGTIYTRVARPSSGK